jgi:hypothetical protein
VLAPVSAFRRCFCGSGGDGNRFRGVKMPLGVVCCRGVKIYAFGSVKMPFGSRLSEASCRVLTLSTHPLGVPEAWRQPQAVLSVSQRCGCLQRYGKTDAVCHPMYLPRTRHPPLIYPVRQKNVKTIPFGGVFGAAVFVVCCCL